MCTFTPLPVVSLACITRATVRAVRVATYSVSMTSVCLDLALIHIRTRPAVPGKACFTRALVATIGVGASCVGSTVVRAQASFVHIHRASEELDFTGAVIILVVMAHNYNFDERRRCRFQQREHLHATFRLELVRLRGAVRKLQTNFFVPILLF